LFKHYTVDIIWELTLVLLVYVFIDIVQRSISLLIYLINDILSLLAAYMSYYTRLLMIFFFTSVKSTHLENLKNQRLCHIQKLQHCSNFVGFLHKNSVNQVKDDYLTHVYQYWTLCLSHKSFFSEFVHLHNRAVTRSRKSKSKKLSDSQCQCCDSRHSVMS